MRGENKQGRFNINYERESFISGATEEMVNTVGNILQWWFYDPVNTVVDPIYDAGGNTAGGRRWIGPVSVPIINVTVTQGITKQNDRGFYNTDSLSITINMDLVEGNRNTFGRSQATYPHLMAMTTTPDKYLRDRIIFRDQVWTPHRVLPMGLIASKFTVIHVDCNQVNPEELVNDPQFQAFANYNVFSPRTI